MFGRNVDVYGTAGTDKVARDRVIDQDNMAKAAGFAVAPPVFSFGTLVNSTGAENYRKSREEFVSLPDAEVALDALAEEVRREQRELTPVKVEGLTMLENGMLDTTNGPVPVEEDAFKKLVSMLAPPGAGEYLTASPTKVRLQNFNYWTSPEGRSAFEDIRPKPAKKVNLRTRRVVDDATRRVFAVVGMRYQPHDADALAKVLKDYATERGAKAEVIYDGYKFSLQITLHSDIAPENCSAGEIFKVGYLIESADDGTKAIKVKAFVLRNRCRNLIILHKSTRTTARRIHVGENIIQGVRDGIAEAKVLIGGFAEKWANAEQDKIIDSGADPRKVFDRLVERGLVKVPGIRKDDLAARLYANWQQEPGYNRKAVINAITRAAHREPWRNPWVGQEMEEQAGKLLYVRNLQLAS